MGRMVFGLSSFWLLLVLVSFVLNTLNAQQQESNIALQSARSFFQQVIITRAWNAEHGHVYVPVSKTAPPNPYLTGNKRDIDTGDGTLLTQINPAYMTRQIAELASQRQPDLRIHITSLNPIRPENQPTPKEIEVLQKFEQGLTEYGEIIDLGSESQFFYMAPLVVEESCLDCHKHQGYKIGDIRGGISVSLPFTPSNIVIPLLLGHLSIGLAGLLGILLAGRKLEHAYNLIKAQSSTDYLTQLDNRRSFSEKLDHGIRVAQRDNSSLALLLLDLDHFKEVNDTLGHPCGDRLLIQVAEGLRSNLRNVDTIARLGGDEFALLIEKVEDAQSAAFVAQKVLRIFKQEWHLEQSRDVKISASIGISLFPAHGDTQKLLMEHADTALYRAKEQGRNCFHFYTKDLTEAAMQRIELENSLKQALLNSELDLYYQPILDTKTSTIVGAEALLRWHHPELGLMIPDTFIAIAEEKGLIKEIGQWALQQCCRQGKKWLDQDINFKTVSLNVNNFQIHHRDFITHLKQALETSQLPPQMLMLELNESTLMADEMETIDLLSTLSDIGVKLAIDNFGTGYSSLSRMQQYPVTHLKIDQRFINSTTDSDQLDSVAQTSILIGQTFSMELIAVGVEQQQQVELLRDAGCHFYQGYAFSPAISAGFFGILLKQSNSSNRKHTIKHCDSVK